MGYKDTSSTLRDGSMAASMGTAEREAWLSYNKKDYKLPQRQDMGGKEVTKGGCVYLYPAEGLID